MTEDQALDQLARLTGIFPEFKDMAGAIHQITPDTQRALLRANGYEINSDADAKAHLRAEQATQTDAYFLQEIVLVAGEAQKLPIPETVDWLVLSEADSHVLAEGRSTGEITLPALPDGVHTLQLKGARGEQTVCLIAAPRHVPLLTEAIGHDRTWGIMAALYGLKTDDPKTLADFGDLAHLATVLGAHGAGFLGINPVHALGEAAKETISPYSPTHRGFLNTDHIAVGDAPILEVPPDMVDYLGHRAGQRSQLKAEFSSFQQRPTESEKADFEQFCRQGGQPLVEFSRFEALSVIHGADSRHWPNHPDIAGGIPQEQLDYQKWLQWRADRQLAEAQKAALTSGMTLGLYLDLAVGARLGGAESWGTHSAAATGVSLGAPPDHLSPAGQNWQLAALSPRRLKAGNFDALRFVLRQNMRHCGLLRIDHALGLNRSFWLPEDGSPGGYIRQPFQSLMAIIAIEAKRAGTVIVGEDLGLVPKGFREDMAARGFYGYSVLQYEKDARGKFTPARKLRPQSLACFGTHDTPTLEGFWQGRDIEWWEKLGWIKPADAARAVDRRTGEKRQLAETQAPDPLPRRAGAGLREKIHASLAQSPAGLVAAQLDDILLLEEAQNLPGTIDEHPNWRRVYPKTIDEIAQGPELKKTAKIMAQAGRACKKMRKDQT